MELRKALPADPVGDLWALCFPQDDGRLYFQTEYNPSDTLVYADGSAVYAMLHILPRRLRLWGQPVPAGYLFGIGTHPDHRGRGLAGDLVEQAFFELRLRGVPVAMLLPGAENVLSLYRRYGFASLSRRPLPTGAPGGRPAGEADIPRLSALYDALPCRAERTAADWAGILAEYSVGLAREGYRVWDERGLLEQMPAPEGAAEHPLRAMLKAVDVEALYALAARAGRDLPPCGPSSWCPWNRPGNRAGAPPEEIFFGRERPYINLLHN